MPYEIVKDKKNGYCLLLDSSGSLNIFLTQKRSTIYKDVSGNVDGLIYYSKSTDVHHCDLCGLPFLGDGQFCHDCRKRIAISGDLDLSEYAFYKMLLALPNYEKGDLLLNEMYKQTVEQAQHRFDQLQVVVDHKDLDVQPEYKKLYLDLLFGVEVRHYRLNNEDDRDSTDDENLEIHDSEYGGYIDKPTARLGSRIMARVYGRMNASEMSDFIDYAMQEYIAHGKESGFRWSYLTNKTYRKNGLYISHCLNCGHTVDSRYNEKCPKCGGYICPSCGSCLCGYTKPAYDDNDAPF